MLVMLVMRMTVRRRRGIMMMMRRRRRMVIRKKREGRDDTGSHGEGGSDSNIVKNSETNLTPERNSRWRLDHYDDDNFMMTTTTSWWWWWWWWWRRKRWRCCLQAVAGSCGSGESSSGRTKEDDNCWYELWYFWSVPRPFFFHFISMWPALTKG